MQSARSSVLFASKVRCIIFYLKKNQMSNVVTILMLLIYTMDLSCQIQFYGMFLLLLLFNKTNTVMFVNVFHGWCSCDHEIALPPLPTKTHTHRGRKLQIKDIDFFSNHCTIFYFYKLSLLFSFITYALYYV